MAASNGQLDCLQYLIETGIDVNAKGGPEHASTLLHEAAHAGHYDCVKLLLSSGNFFHASIFMFKYAKFTPISLGL